MEIYDNLPLTPSNRQNCSKPQEEIGDGSLAKNQLLDALGCFACIYQAEVNVVE